MRIKMCHYFNMHLQLRQIVVPTTHVWGQNNKSSFQVHTLILRLGICCINRAIAIGSNDIFSSFFKGFYSYYFTLDNYVLNKNFGLLIWTKNLIVCTHK